MTKKQTTLYIRLFMEKRLKTDEVRSVSINAKQGIRALYARKRRKILSYLFDRDKWSLEKARVWYKKNFMVTNKKIYKGGYLVKSYGTDIDILLTPDRDLEGLYDAMEQAVGKATMRAYDVGITETGALQKPIPKALQAKAIKHALSLSKFVTDTLKENLARIIIDGVNAGDSNAEIASKILAIKNKPLTINVKPKYDAQGNITRQGYTRQMSAKQWADVVARTETAKASNTAIGQAYADVGVAKKMWTTNPGACEICAPMDGKVFEINEKTENLIPAHPNCRCYWLPVIEKQIAGRIHKGVKVKGKEIYLDDVNINLR